MAFTDYNALGTIGHDLFVVAGSFEVSPTVVSAAKGFGATPTYGGSAGLYNLTMDEAYPAVISCNVSFGGAVANDEITMVSWAYTAATGVLAITFRSDTAGAAAALGAATQINYLVVLQRKSSYGVV